MGEFNPEHGHHEIPKAKIKVVGIGGGGSNAVNSMVHGELEGVDFIVANTDAQALYSSPVEHKIQLGMKITKGLGAGSNPEIGRRAAEEDLDTIVSHLADADILFLTAGMGGGTGTGATPVIARAAREGGTLTVGVVTKPFLFEGRRRKQQADDAIELLRGEVDTLIVIPNQKLLEVADPNISVLDAFAMANDVLMQAIKGVSDIIVRPGHINVDFADVKEIMKGMGMAIMGTGRAKGEDRACQAASNAINSPLVEDVSIEGAKGVLINITGNCNLGLQEISDAANVIYEKASNDAIIILGSVINPDIGDEIMVTVIATGFEPEDQKASGLGAATKAIEMNQVASTSISQIGKETEEAIVTSESILNEEKQTTEGSSQEASELRDEPVPKAKAAKEAKTLPEPKIDLDDLDTPTFIRKKAEERQSVQEK